MKIPGNMIHPINGEVAGFDGLPSTPKGHVTLIVTVIGRQMPIDFLLMNCSAPYNGILGRDWTVPMEVVASARYQCLKFPNQGRISKVRSNQLATDKCNEKAFEEHKLSEVNSNTIFAAYYG